MRKIYLLFVAMLALALPMAVFAAEGDTATIEMNGKPGYEGISGMTTLTDNGDGTTKVMIELDGTPEGGSHPSHFHNGTSCTQNEPIEITLNNVEDGMSETMVEESFDELVEFNYYLNVHLSEAELATVVACGDEYMTQGGGEGDVQDDQQSGDDQEDSPDMPESGAGALSQESSALPVMGLFGVAMAAGALLFARSRSA